MPPSARADVLALVATLDEERAATFRDAPGRTIVPAALSTSGARALAVLQQLAGRSPGASVQLVHGEVIGEGGMGVVRSAEQVALGRTVAIKTLKRRDPGAALDLLREAWVTGAVEHPNVVPVHFVELDAEGMPLVAMKRVSGAPWSELVRDPEAVARRFGATDLLAWNLGVLTAALNAIRFAHHRGVIHRDLKPANVMIGDFGEVYLLDWGIAVALHDDGSGRLPVLSGTPELAGTPSYMAPEMLGREGSPPLSERTDVYLAGAVLFELIAGAVPHRGTDILSVIASIVGGAPELPPTAPPELARICERAMHEDPAQRYESVEALRLAIQSYLEHRGSTEIGARAQSLLGELRALLAAPGAEPAAVYRAFGACRFGFHESLAVWRDNAAARAGLAEATTAVAEYELANDRPAAALALLADVEAPALVARARAATEASAAERAELERVRAAHDPTIGRRTRTFLVGLLGIGFVLIPFFYLRSHESTHRDHILASVLGEVTIIGLTIWARHTVMATLYNRRLLATQVFVFLVQGVLATAEWWLDIPPATCDVTFLGLWFAISGMTAIAIEPRLAPCSIAYLVAFLLAARWPEQRANIIPAVNLIYVANAMWVWRPATLRPTPEERARMRATRARRRGP